MSLSESNQDRQTDRHICIQVPPAESYTIIHPSSLDSDPKSAESTTSASLCQLVLPNCTSDLRNVVKMRTIVALFGSQKAIISGERLESRQSRWWTTTPLPTRQSDPNVVNFWIPHSWRGKANLSFVGRSSRETSRNAGDAIRVEATWRKSGTVLMMHN